MAADSALLPPARQPYNLSPMARALSNREVGDFHLHAESWNPNNRSRKSQKLTIPPSFKSAAWFQRLPFRATAAERALEARGKAELLTLSPLSVTLISELGSDRETRVEIASLCLGSTG